MRYEDVYARAFPFDKMIEGLFQEKMIQDTVKLIHESAAQEVTINVIVNNHAGGNAPMIAQEICKRGLVFTCGERFVNEIGQAESSKGWKT
jgi:hypothetical protein